MSVIPPDTSPQAFTAQVKAARGMTAEAKLRQVCALNRAVRELALSGLRARHPAAPEEEVRRRLADLLLGAELAQRVYGLGPEENP